MSEKITADIQSALDGDMDARKVFSALPASHKDEYLRWVGEAKKSETRSRRIATMLERLKA